MNWSLWFQGIVVTSEPPTPTLLETMNDETAIAGLVAAGEFSMVSFELASLLASSFFPPSLPVSNNRRSGRLQPALGHDAYHAWTAIAHIRSIQDCQHRSITESS